MIKRSPEQDIEHKESHEKISPTAKLVAQLRTFTDIPFAAEIAQESGSEQTFRELAGDQADLFIKLASPLIESRYKVTDHVLKQRGMSQVLEIATGLSPRGLAMTENPQVTYFATDLPQMLEQEKTITENILAGSGTERPNLHFRELNALDQNNMLAVAEGFNPNEQIAVVNEGLLMYFDREEKKTVAENIRKLLSRFGGVWITPDIATKPFMQRVLQAEQSLRLIVERISGITARNIESNTFTDDGDISQFFDEAGFEIEEFPHAGIIDDLSSIQILGLDREQVMKILGARKSLILTPKK